VYEKAKEMGYTVLKSLPVLKPLPITAQELVFIEIQLQTYLAVSVEPGLVDHYHLVTLQQQHTVSI